MKKNINEMTMTELVKEFVDKKAFIQIGYDLEAKQTVMCEVQIKDIKRSYGKLRYKVAPRGVGQMWVETVNFVQVTEKKS